MAVYTTKENDELDDVCEAYYGFHVGTVEAVLEANINLSAYPHFLPAGVKIIMPEIIAKRDDIIQIFD